MKVIRLAVATAALCASTAAAQITNYLDFRVLGSAPSNPPASRQRFFATAAGLTCLNSTGGSCLTATGSSIGGPVTVSGLPASAATNMPYIVTDGTTGTDCSVGGGSDQVLCGWTGAAWVAIPSTVSGTSGANTTLSNLGTTSLNQSLLFQTGLDIGSATKPARDLYLFGAGTYGTNYFRLTGTPTGTRVLTLPDVTGTLLYSGGPLGTPSSGTGTNLTGIPISTGISGLGSGVATWLGTPSSANLLAAMTTKTGTGLLVFGTSPTLVTPNLGTPSTLICTNCTGLPLGGITGLGTGIATWLGTPSSANLLAAMTTKTGTGNLVFANSPALITPDLGIPSALDLTHATKIPLVLTTTGTSGAATYTQATNTLNIPQYTTGGGSSAFSSLTGGTNTGAAMLVGSGASLGATGSGTIAATSAPLGGISGLGTGVATALAGSVSGTGAICLASGSACGGTGGGYSGLINAATTVICDGTTDMTTRLNTLLGAAGGTIIMPQSALACVISNLAVTANSITLDLEGGTLQVKSGTTGIALLVNGVTNFTLRNGTIDGNSIAGVTWLVQADNSTGVHLDKVVLKNAGTPGVGNFQSGVDYFQTQGDVTNSTISNIAGYCLEVNGAGSAFSWGGNHFTHCYKDGAVFNGTTPTWVGAGNIIDHVYDYGGASTGAYGNGVNVTASSNGGILSGLLVAQTEYSGVRVSDSANVTITGVEGYQTGDWCIYGQDFGGGNNSITGNKCHDMLGGGINIANAGDNAAFGVNVSGNQMYNALGSSTNAGGLTPFFANGFLGDGFVHFSSNVVNGAYYGAACNNGESGVYVDVGCEITTNQIIDTRPVTLTLTGTSGSVTGSQSGVTTDKIYLTSGGSLDGASKSAVVLSCAPISSGATCNSPTSITVAPILGFFAPSDGITDNGPTGNLTATVSTVTGPALYDLALSSVTNFALFDNVHIGTGATAATGFITCSTNVITSSGCPSASHITVAGTLNGAGLMVPFPASGTLTDDTSGATASITARTSIPVNMQAGVIANANDTTSGKCSILVNQNNIWGYAVADIDGINGTSLTTPGSGTCIHRP